MANKVLKVIIISGCFVTCLLLQTMNYKLNKKIGTLNLKIDSLMHYQHFTDMLIENTTFQFDCEGSNLEIPLSLIDENNKRCRINEISGANTTLIFRFSEINCTSCVETQFRLIRKYISKYGKNNIIIVASYSNIRNLTIFKRINEISIPIYRIEQNQLCQKVESLNVPYYFLLEDEVEMRMIHIPSKEIPSLTLNYLNLIGKRFEK